MALKVMDMISVRLSNKLERVWRRSLSTGLRVSFECGFPDCLPFIPLIFRICSEIQLKDTDWQYEDELDSLRDDIKLIADQCRADETKKMVNAIEVSHDLGLALHCVDARDISLEESTETTCRASGNWPWQAERRYVG